MQPEAFGFHSRANPAGKSAEAAERGAQWVSCPPCIAARAIVARTATTAATTTAVAVATTAAQGVDACAQRVGLAPRRWVQAWLADAHAAQVGVGARLTFCTVFAWATVFTRASSGTVTARAAWVA